MRWIRTLSKTYTENGVERQELYCKAEVCFEENCDRCEEAVVKNEFVEYGYEEQDE